MAVENEHGSLDLIWGVNAIAKVIGRTDSQTFHMCQSGAIPARKIGRSWVIERSKLVAHFMETAA